MKQHTHIGCVATLVVAFVGGMVGFLIFFYAVTQK